MEAKISYSNKSMSSITLKGNYDTTKGSFSGTFSVSDDLVNTFIVDRKIVSRNTFYLVGHNF
jgi:hypothetical protein